MDIENIFKIVIAMAVLVGMSFFIDYLMFIIGNQPPKPPRRR